MRPLIFFILAFTLAACGSDSIDPTEETTEETETPVANSSGCENYNEAFTPLSDLVSYECDDTYLFLTSETGLPETQNVDDDDKIMVGIVSWIQRVPIPYFYDWRIPLNPAWAEATTEAPARGPMAFAIDGVPIFHYERRPDVSTALSNYTAQNDTVIAGELDQCGGHAGQGDDYHYHYAPVCLLENHDMTQPIAFGLDGAPVYFGEGGDDYYGRGRFTDLNNFPEGVSADTLDDCNAVMQDDGSYIHYTTKTPPYLIGCHHAPFDTALQIEPSPMTGREQGLVTPLGGEYGEPEITNFTGFEHDEDGVYTVMFDAIDGSDQTSSIIYSLESSTDEENCWQFEFRVNADEAGIVEIACRNNETNTAILQNFSFTHDHVH